MTELGGPNGHAPFSVKTTGTGPAMILIPGLSSSGEVWRTAVDHYRPLYTCHVLTLAGFADGPPPLESGPFLQATRDGVLQYVRENQLNKPVIVGHSLGGSLGLWIAITAPDLVGPVVSVDGLPYPPALMDPNATPESTRAQADALGEMFAAFSSDQLEAHARVMLARMISSPKQIDVVAGWSRRSDSATVGRAFAESMTIDLRSQLAAITTSVLVVGAAKQVAGTPKLERLTRAYEEQVATIPRHRVVMATSALHFVMLDDPRFLFSTMDEFLGAETAVPLGRGKET